MDTITITRVSIPMSIEEREALRAMAIAELRDPREQARYLLRQALGLKCEEAQSQPMHNRTGAVIEAVPSAIAP
jgi:hypothetical protein